MDIDANSNIAIFCTKTNLKQGDTMVKLIDDNKPNIWFKYEGTEYFTSMDAYDKGKYVELPDGKLLGVRMWLESYPPQMSGIHVVEGTPENRVHSVKAEFNNPQAVVTPIPEPVVDTRPTIGFSFEGQRYTTSIDAYPSKNIELPDGRLLGIRGWLESYPPQVSGPHLIEDNPANRSNSVKAKLSNLNTQLDQVDTNNQKIQSLLDENDRALNVKSEATQTVRKEPGIDFSFEGKEYTTSMDAYPGKYIALPDGRLLGVQGWFESYPPQMSGPHVVEDTPENRANSVKADFNGPNPAVVNDKFSEVFRKMDEINSLLGIQNSSASVDERLGEISRRMAEMRNDSGNEPENKSHPKLK